MAVISSSLLPTLVAIRGRVSVWAHILLLSAEPRPGNPSQVKSSQRAGSGGGWRQEGMVGLRDGVCLAVTVEERRLGSGWGPTG